MPSIRRSLIVYFLLLLALALTGMAFLADGVTGRALQEKETASAELIDLNAQDKEQEERDKFDRELLALARSTHRTAIGDWAVHAEQIKARSEAVIPAALFGLNAAPSSLAPLTTAIDLQAMHQPVPGRRQWVSGPMWGPIVQAVVQANADESNYTAFLTRHLEEEPGAPLIQIDHSSRGLVWKSTALPTAGLPFDRERWDAFGEDARYDTLTLSSGSVRRVIFKSPTSGGFRWGWGPQPRPEARSAPPQGPPTSSPPSPRPASTGPSVNYYHVAKSTADLEATVADIHADANRQKGEVRQATAATRNTVRWLLLAGSVFAFLGLLVGGWLVVGLGLRPLQKLTNAVARVNEKDLHLPVAAGELSHELVPIHDRLAQTLDQLREAFEREKQAVADISHELRTPVASLLATIDITLRKPRTAEQYKQALEDCRLLTKQLGGLVERVMTLAYLDAGHTQVSTAPTDATDLASGCAAVIRPLAESHGLTLNTDLRPTPPVDTDADKLREVVINLLHNAVEYNKPGGSITLAVRREKNGGPLVVEVSDTGIGMSADVRGRIFERFYRADASRTATGVHAGLGLSIVKEYVSRLGGTISVESEVDRGSTFRVTLPG
jgi:signal transduction histidine kinase